MELAAINSPATAFIAGLVTSLHCAGMCGPLACGLMPVRGDRADGHTVATAYHLSRLAAYAALGALAGGIGRTPLTWVSQSALRWLPWVLVLFFVAGFLYHHDFSGGDPLRDSLLPFQKENPPKTGGEDKNEDKND